MGGASPWKTNDRGIMGQQVQRKTLRQRVEADVETEEDTGRDTETEEDIHRSRRRTRERKTGGAKTEQK
jgi:hypothetical protein